jgi:hypothetical protein
VQELLEGKTTPQVVMSRVRQRQREVKRELQAKGNK